MSDTFITMIAVIAVAIVMFIFPLMTTANQNDEIMQTGVQVMVSDFVNTSAKEGKITSNNYYAFLQQLIATGNSYALELEVKKVTDNPERTGNSTNVIGENIYYSEFTNQIEEKINGEEQAYYLKQGDYIRAKVENTNLTFGTILKNTFYSIVGKDTIAIEASASALVTTTGSKK